MKWKEPFQDEHEKDDAYLTSWSAEDQKILLENPANKAAVEKVTFIDRNLNNANFRLWTQKLFGLGSQTRMRPQRTASSC